MDISNKKVSIVTVYYNREDYVKESINSLINQTHQNIEIIAVNDGSTDNTLDKLHSINDSRLTIISHKNMGFVKSVIKAIKHANSEYIAIHGSGDISFKDRIEKQLKLLLSRPDIGVVGCYVENIDLTLKQKKIHKPRLNNNSTTKTFLDRNIFTHGEVMFRKSVYNEVGGYRQFFKYSQDYDLWLRMSLVTKFDIVEEVLYRRYTLPGGVSASYDKKIMQKYFAETSRQALIMRMKYGYDFVDKHGYYSAFYRKKSKRLSRELFMLSLNALSIGDKEKAIYINKLSRNEKKTLLNSLNLIILHVLCRNKKVKQQISKNLMRLRTKLNKGELLR